MNMELGRYCPYCAAAFYIEEAEDEYEKGAATCPWCGRIFLFSTDDGLLILEEQGGRHGTYNTV